MLLRILNISVPVLSHEPMHLTSVQMACQSVHTVILHRAKYELTFVIVPSITTTLFQSNTAVSSIPAIITATFPCTIAVDSTLTMPTAAVWAALHSTMTAIPASDTETCAIFTLPMLITPVMPLNFLKKQRWPYHKWCSFIHFNSLAPEDKFS